MIQFLCMPPTSIGNDMRVDELAVRKERLQADAADAASVQGVHLGANWTGTVGA